MSKEAVFTMKLEPELRAEFMAEAEAAHRPASQILRDLMREFVQRQVGQEIERQVRAVADQGRDGVDAAALDPALGDDELTAGDRAACAQGDVLHGRAEERGHVIGPMHQEPHIRGFERGDLNPFGGEPRHPSRI